MDIRYFQYFELLSLILALILQKGLRRHSIALFVPLLIIINVTEVLGVNHTLLGWKDNYMVYNLGYLILATVFMLMLFYRMLDLDSRKKKIFKFMSTLLVIFLLLNASLFQGAKTFNTWSLITIELVNIVLSSFVLFQLVFNTKSSKNLFREPYFWINIGTLFFGLGSIVLFGLQQFIIKNNLQINHKSLYHIMGPILDVILYTAWSYGFIQCSKK